jgi:hypothetical protein
MCVESQHPLAFLQDERLPIMAIVYHQIFCDESGKHQQDPVIAFSGICATQDRLEPFNRAWRGLLTSYELDALHMERVSRLVESHGYRFASGQTFEERIELLYPFADCINKYLEVGFHQAWSVKGYNFLSVQAKRLLGGSDDPYFLAFVRGLQAVVRHFSEDDRINVVVDDDLNTAWDCYRHYRAVGKADWEIQKRAVSLTFANDKHFPALQAADMLAFLTRHEAKDRFYKQPNAWKSLYSRLTTEPEPAYGLMRWFRVFAAEEELLAFATEMQQLAEQRTAERAAKNPNGKAGPVTV